MKHIKKGAFALAFLASCFYGIQVLAGTSRGPVIMLVLLGIAAVCVCCVIFWMTRAYYSPEASFATADGSTPRGFLRGRTEISLEELSRVWKPRAEAQKQTKPETSDAVKAKLASPAVPPAVTAEQLSESETDNTLPWNNQVEDSTPEVIDNNNTQEDTVVTQPAGETDEMAGFGFVPQPSPPRIDQSETPPEGLVFRHEAIVEYYNERICTKKRGFLEEPVRLRVVESILSLLDKHGDCPSVVDALAGYGDPNSDLKRVKARSEGTSLYDVLGQVTLLDHSLNVARRIEALREGSTQVPLFIIEALAHDLGKIPAFRQGTKSYATGDHPIIACNILQAEVDGFVELPEKDRKDIEGAVRYHHREAFQIGDIDMEHLRLLQKADREARSAEVASQLKDVVSAAPVTGGESAPAEYFKEEPTRRQKAEEKEAKATQMQEAFNMGKDMDLSWVDTRVFFERLMPYINNVQNGCYKAISTPDGYVYVWTDLLKQIMNEMALAAGQPDITAAVIGSDVNQQGRWWKLKSIANKLRDEGFIASNLIAKGYFSAPFLVSHKDGRQDELSACPFVVEAFGVNPSDLEIMKKDTLVRNITSVTVDRRTKAERKERKSE